MDKTNKAPLPNNATLVSGETLISKKLVKGSILHDKLLEKLKDCFALSYKTMSTFYNQWEKYEKIYDAEAYKCEADKIPEFKFPEAFTQIDTIKTYIKSVLFAQSPMFHIQGVESDDVSSAELIETVIDYQIRNMDVRKVLNTLIQDALLYNIGIIRNEWTEEWGWVQIDDPTFGIIRDFRKVYQGNRASNIEPYNYFPDPRVIASNVNEGEFVGFTYDKSFNDLYKYSAVGQFFNIEYVKEEYASIIDGRIRHNSNVSSILYNNKGESIQGASIYGEQVTGDGDNKDRVEMAQIEIELVPSQYGISDNNIPEKWIFTIANRDTIVQAEQYSCQHGKFSAIPLVPYNDGHSFISKGLISRVEAYQEGESWLFNSHLQNVVRILNNNLVVDPELINVADISYSRPGNIIRTNPGNSGIPVSQGIMQLQVQDVTGTHMIDIESMRGIVQKITGANDNFMGTATASRKTATEVRAMNGMAGTKLSELTADIYAYCIKPWVEQMVANTQQYMNEALVLRIAGKSNINSNKPVQISREDIQGKFDYIMPDITNPPDRMAELALWKEFFMGIAQSPELMQTFDIVQVFMEMAKKANIKNVKDFIRQDTQNKQPTPQQQVASVFGGGSQQQQQSTNISEDPMQNMNTAGESTLEGMFGGIR